MPYFIASHPGSDLHAMIDLALFLKRNGYRPDQVQDFIPAPFDIATCMYYTASTRSPSSRCTSPRDLRDRKMQRALMQFFKPENYFEVREALLEAGRGDLIGNGCDGLIPATPAERGHRGADGRRAQVRPDRARRRPRPGRLSPRAPGAEGGRLSPRPPTSRRRT